MLITAIISVATVILFALYTFKGRLINKNIKTIDKEIRDMLVGEPKNADPLIEDTETDKSELDKDKLIDMYNKRAELDNEIVEHNKNAIIMGIIAIVVTVITVVAAVILKTPV